MSAEEQLKALWEKFQGLNPAFASALSPDFPKLVAYADLLQRWSVKVDLIAPASLEHTLEFHILDSLAGLACLASAGIVSRETVPADIGSGAGLPGLVWGIQRPHTTVVLVEPRDKRCQFLKEVRRELGLQKLAVVQKRAEELNAPDLLGASVAVSRAVGDEAHVLASLSSLLPRPSVISWMVSSNWKGGDLKSSATALAKHLGYTLPGGARLKVVAIERT